MIKQPDVLLLHFLYSHDYSLANKRANFEFYEPRCIHESSLSPGIHSILAAELGLEEKAYEYWAHTARLDLDNYNRNTHEGVHTTSMASAWLNLVYGFGGMRSDGERLSFRPSLPRQWKSFGFRLLYRGSVLQVGVDPKTFTCRVVRGPSVSVDVFDQTRRVTASGIAVAMRNSRRERRATSARRAP
jgi:maltose phosphorylase